MARLASIWLYPIKSLDPVFVPQGRILRSVALEHDRQFAIVDSEGAVVNAKRTPRIHLIRARFDLAAGTVDLEAEGAAGKPLRLNEDRPDIEQWLSTFFAMPVRLTENTITGFPDDLDSPGPTVVSTATLESVAGWFSLPIDEVRRRFRANLEIDGVEPFWEDCLFGEVGSGHRFQIGGTILMGANPCPRCVVPSRDSHSGEIISGFARTFADHRQQALPAWASLSHFDHCYRLATNTRPYASGGLRIGDEVQIF